MKSAFKGRKILVTGATGFIGSSLCYRLKNHEAEIIGVSTQNQTDTQYVDNWIKGNLVDQDFTHSLVKNSKPDFIFHLAAYVSGSRVLDAVLPSFHNNLTSTVNILTSSTKIGIKRLVLAGSLEEPGDGEEHDFPVSPYAASKWAGTNYAKMFYKLYDTPVTIPRIFMVYGPGRQDHNKLVPYLIQSLLKKKSPQLSSGSRLVDWIFISDLVDGLLKMATVQGIEGKTIDLGTGQMYAIREIAEKINSIIGYGTDLDFGARKERPFERERKANIERTGKYLNWKPEVQLDEGLEQTVNWFRNQAINRFG